MLAPLLLALSSLAPVLAARPTPSAAEAEVHLLWPGGAPGALGAEAKDRPRILVTHAARTELPHAAIVICPGGGYGTLAMEHEGHAIARWTSSLGITAAILEYRHRGKGYGHPQPLLDAQRALRFVRAHAAEWNVAPDRIGVLGFSAGGHLASSVSVHHDEGVAEATDPIERRSSRPDFAILCYPVIAFGQKHTHLGSQRNLLGPEPTEALLLEMSSERQVTRRTPPAFLWHTSDDPVVPVQNSLAYYLALREHQVPCELHVFERGAHGLGLAEGHAASAWPELCRRWLVTRGVLAP